MRYWTGTDLQTVSGVTEDATRDSSYSMELNASFCKMALQDNQCQRNKEERESRDALNREERDTQSVGDGKNKVKK